MEGFQLRFVRDRLTNLVTYKARQHLYSLGEVIPIVMYESGMTPIHPNEAPF